MSPSSTRPAPTPDATLMYTTLLHPLPAPHTSSASAPRFASLSTSTGSPQLRVHQLLGLHSDPAGQDRRVPDLARLTAQRAGKAHADGHHALAGHLQMREQTAHQAGGAGDALGGGLVDVVWFLASA